MRGQLFQPSGVQPHRRSGELTVSGGEVEAVELLVSVVAAASFAHVSLATRVPAVLSQRAGVERRERAACCFHPLRALWHDSRPRFDSRGGREADCAT